jgi:hypothetical protein
MLVPTQSTAASSAARAAAPGIRPSVEIAQIEFETAWRPMSGPTRTTAASSAARTSGPGSRPSVATPRLVETDG